MKKIKFIKAILISTVICCSSCIQSEMYTECVTVNPDVSMKCVDFIDECVEIRLEKTDSCLISNVDAVRFFDHYIGIQSNNVVYLFDDKGHFKRKIGSVGRGKGEYLSICDFQLLEDRVLVLAGLQKKLLEYKIDGTHLKTHDLDDTYFRFRILDGNRIVLASQNGNDTHVDFVWYDIEKDKVAGTSGQFKKDEGLMIPDFDSFIGFNNDWITYLFDYSVYSLAGPGDEIKKHITFEFSTTEQMPDNKDELGFIKLEEYTANKNVVRYLRGYGEVGNVRYLIYPLFGEHGIQTCITRIDKDGVNKTCKVSEEVDNDYPYFCVGNYMNIHDDKIVLVRDADTILRFEEGNRLSHYADTGLKNGDNPILFLYKLKP